jgi:hypothetical protein
MHAFALSRPSTCSNNKNNNYGISAFIAAGRWRSLSINFGAAGI